MSVCNNNNNDSNSHIERRNSRFYNLLTVLQTVHNAYMQAVRAQSCANHMQHIVCLSHATCCGMKGQLTYYWFDRVSTAFILALPFWLKPLANEGEEKTRVPGENPRQQASENATF